MAGELFLTTSCMIHFPNRASGFHYLGPSPRFPCNLVLRQLRIAGTHWHHEKRYWLYI